LAAEDHADGELEGWLVPADTEVGWELPEGTFTYWRAAIAGLVTLAVRSV
jgi:hypothetical protein